MAAVGDVPYDLCIVGAGMVGSAIARHVSELKPDGYKLCLIGPQEPQHRVCVRGNEVFGAHYDAGRLTGSLSAKDVWARLAYSSMKRYMDIEAKSGIPFYKPSGLAYVGKDSFLSSVCQPGRSYKLNTTELTTQFPFISFAPNDSALFDPDGGVINPRKLVNAEIVIASGNGCDVMRDIVDDVSKVSNSFGDICMRVTTEGGRVYWAKKVVLATNTFTTSRQLLPASCVPRFHASPQTVVMGEVDQTEVEKLSNCPSMVYKGPGGRGWSDVYPTNNHGDVRFYLVDPVTYPDGKVYIKIGHSDDILKGYLEPGDISRWHCTGGDPWIVRSLTDLLKVMFPGVKFKSFMSDSCATMVTATDLPYIDMVHGGLGVAIGGNGHAAKSSDEVGRLAACMMLNIDPVTDLDMDLFRLVTRDKNVSKL